MAELFQLPCGRGEMALDSGGCVHQDAQLWQMVLDSTVPHGMRYVGTEGDPEWPVHMWQTGSRHDGGNPEQPVIPVKPVAETKDDRTAKRTQEVWRGDGRGAVPVAYRRIWPELLEQLPAHPAPAVTSRQPEPEGARYPSAVLKLAERAREAGWQVLQQYARGNGVHGGHGRATAVRDSYALRFGGHPLTHRQAYAVYHGAAWKSIALRGPDLPPFTGASVTDLAEFLEHPLWTQGELVAWVQAIRQRLADKAEAKAAAPRKAATGSAARREVGG